MKRMLYFLMCLAVLVNPVAAVAATPTPAALVFRTVHTKGDDFLFLQATVDVELSDYWLGYDSSLPVDELYPEYQLPAGRMRAGQVLILVNDAATSICDADLSAAMPVSLADTKGSLAMWRQQPAENSSRDLIYEYQDGFSWSTSTKVAADIIFSDSTMVNPVGYRDLASDNWAWGVGVLAADEHGCRISPKGVNLPDLIYDNGSNQDGEIVIETPSVVSDEGGVGLDVEVPEAVGRQLLPVQLSEVLPNPVGTGTDVSGEFIELYNPNDEPLSLSGYEMRVGLSTKHSYKFTDGENITPKGFKAFFTKDTGLTLSNSGGMVEVFDEGGQLVVSSDPYTVAPDGKSWIKSDGEWQWTTRPTAGAVNEVVGVSSASVVLGAATNIKKAVKAVASKTKASAKKVTTKKPKAVKTSKAKAAKTATAKTAQAASFEKTEPVRAMHPAVLALVALAAVGYGLYEYRQDLANRFHKLRANRATRRAHRK